MKRKGISPLIAAVLLIAFTMAVASIFAQWAPQLMEDAQGDTSEQAQNIQSCSDRTLDLNVDTSDNSATITQTGGSEGIGNMTVTFYYDTADPTQQTVEIPLNESRGVATASGDSANTLTEVQVNPIDCEGAPGASWDSE